MPEFTDPLTEQISDASSGLMALLAEAHETWQARTAEAAAGAGVAPADTPGPLPAARAKDGADSPSGGDGAGAMGISHMPGWRSFEDAFPTFYQFTNRPR